MQKAIRPFFELDKSFLELSPLPDITSTDQSDAEICFPDHFGENNKTLKTLNIREKDM